MSCRALHERQPACKPGSVGQGSFPCVTAIPLGRRFPAASSNLPGRLIRTRSGKIPRRPYSVLLPVGFTVPLPLPERAVRSYRTVSPLPAMSRRSVFCGTFPGVAPAGRYPAPFVHGARTFLPGNPHPTLPACGEGRVGEPERPSGRLTPLAWGCGAAASRAGRILRRAWRRALRAGDRASRAAKNQLDRPPAPAGNGAETP